MRCPSCQHQNPAAANFCQECGERVQAACSGCGAVLPPTAKFCHECGQRSAEPPTPESQPVVEAPQASFAAGRYQVAQLLGEGARKRVYLARDTRLEREVALSIIKADGLDDAGRMRVRREAQAMARLGDHPNVGTVHDIVEEDGQLYIVSEYMAGGDLDQVLDEAADKRRIAIGEAVRIATELCCALEHAHAHGVVHRDVKPGNVWLSRDGAVKLGDFGLAVSTDRTRLTHEGMMVGTAAYMAPEQALGRAADARSDLYALGATLYEMLTGRPPFLGDDAVSIISQHIHTPPVAPTWHNPKVSERIEAVVLAMLEKDPDKRPQTATDVREQLARATSASAESARADEPSDANPLDRLASGVFVGREAELETLRAGVDQSLSGHGRILLLVGEPGIGKTRTSEELATYAKLRGAQVLWGRCFEGEGAPAFWPWMQIIRAFVHERDPQTLLSEMGTGAAEIAEVVSEVRERLPGLPEPPKLDPDQARFRLFDSITGFLRNASRQTPLMVVLDDLHWADKPSLLLLQFLARELGEARLLILGTYRDVEVGRQHPLEQTLAELARAQRADRVLLRGLTEDDVLRFVSLSAGKTPPAALVEAVYRETEGNPFFVHEVVRLLQSDGRLEHPESVESWSVEIPQGVRQVIGRRLDALGEDANAVLTVASIIGREFELRALARAADRSEDETLELLEAAEEARIIAPIEGASGSFRFSHALVRETLYEEVRTTRRIRLHRRIADVLEERYAGHLEPHLAALAYHYCEAASGGDVAKAVDYAQQAARRALDSLAYEEAADHFDRALLAHEAAEKQDERLRCELLLAKGDALFRAGAGQAVIRTFQEAHTLARAIASPIHVALALIGGDRIMGAASETNQEYVGDLDDAIATLDDRPVLLGRLHARRAAQLSWSNLAEARKSAERAAELVQASGGTEGTDQLEAAVEANMVYSRFVVREGKERLARAVALAERARASGAPGVESRAATGVIVSALVLGDVDLADRFIARVAELADEIREPMTNAQACRIRAMRALSQGRLDEARQLSWEGRLQHRRIDEGALADQAFQSQLWGQRRLQGRIGETIDDLRAGAAAFPGAPIWRGLLVCAEAESGDLAGARSTLEALLSDDSSTARGRNPAEVLGLAAEACVAVEHREGAEAIYARLLPVRDQHLMLNTLVSFGSAARCLGNLAMVLDRLDDAETHFEEAIAFDERMRARGMLPRTQCDFARMLLTRSGPGDRECALSLLDEAMSTSQELGLKGWLDRCIETKLAAQGVDSGSASAKGSIDVLVASLSQRRSDLAADGEPAGTVALLVSDVEGFTPMTERLGDHRAREVIRDHNRIVRSQVSAHDGNEVEIQGDAFFLVFGDASAALRCAISLQREFAAYSDTHPEPIRIRIGLHVGEALRDGDRYFGRNVILTARVAAQANGGEILASAAIGQRVRGLAGVHLAEAQTVRLKGIAEPQQIHSVAWDSPAEA